MEKSLGIIGRKLGMTQVFLEDGSAVPVTVVEAGPCPVVQKKTKARDGYDALQLGFLPKEARKVNKPLTGHYQKAAVAPSYHLREFRLEAPAEMEPGQAVTVDLFKPGDIVDVTGVSKGKGFAGVIKRHGFKGAKASRGTHEYFRHGGSVGANSFPAHVFKGHRMPGHCGDQRVTIQNITVMDVKEDQNLILLQGGLPGSRQGLVMIRRATKKKTASSASD